jgi:hypothetical protein
MQNLDDAVKTYRQATYKQKHQVAEPPMPLPTQPSKPWNKLGTVDGDCSPSVAV